MTISERVENILKASVKARNSDKYLWVIYAQKSGVNLSPSQIEAINNMPEFETIRRVRQKLQEDGRYPAADKVKQQRKEKAEIVKQNINHAENPLWVELMEKPTPSWAEGLGGQV